MHSYGAHCEINGFGMPVLMIHDIFGPEPDFFELPQLICPHFQVHQITLPGYGEEDPVFPGTPNTYLHWLVNLIKKFDLKKFHCIGFGMGGSLALALAAAFPVQLKKVTAVHPWQITNPISLQGWRFFFRFKPFCNVFIDQTLQGLFELQSGLQTSDEYRQVIHQIKKDPNRKNQILQILPAMLQKNRPLIKQCYAINQPVQLIWGKQTHWMPQKAGRFLESILQSVDFTLIENCGYGCTGEKKDEIAQCIIHFLQRLESS